jgi:hypothetical protein
MSRTRTYAILAIYVTAAVITPTPDIMTLNLMALPMLFLYEICIWLAWFDRKKERQREAAEEEELRRRRQQWMLNDTERETLANHDHPDLPEGDPEGNVSEAGDHGWHDDYHHHGDGHWHDEYHDKHRGLPGDEDWTEPEDAVTGESTDNIPEEEKKRMNDGKGDE